MKIWMTLGIGVAAGLHGSICRDLGGLPGACHASRLAKERQ
jgi:hypothetical protein